MNNLFLCRAKKWVVNLRNASLDKLPLVQLQNKLVCSKHFEDSAYSCVAERSTTSRLNWNATPTIVDCLRPPKTITSKQKKNVHCKILQIHKENKNVQRRQDVQSQNFLKVWNPPCLMV